MVDYIAQLSKLKLSGVSSLYLYQLGSRAATAMTRSISSERRSPFPSSRTITSSYPYRGPFSSSKGFANTHMAAPQHNITKLQHLQHSEDSDSYNSNDKEQAEGMADIFAKLQKVIAKVFAASPEASFMCEEISLYNRDISVNNILTDSSGDLISIVDWECTIATPSWHSSQLPQFLEGLLTSPTSTTPTKQPSDLRTPEALADPDALAFYNERLQDYELNCLRQFFVEMQRQCPE
jgi:hypothetical protein